MEKSDWVKLSIGIFIAILVGSALMPAILTPNAHYNGTYKANNIQTDATSSANIQWAETGLPSGTKWSVTATGLDPYNEPITITQSSSGTNTVQIDGTFQEGTVLSYSISDVAANGKTYKPAPSADSLTLAASNSVSVTFSQIPGNLLTVNMLGGLPGIFYDLPWSGFITNNQSIYLPWNTASTQFSFNVPNGTYYFQFNGSAGNYEPSIPNGYVTVFNGSYTINFQMNEVYVNKSFYISFAAYGIKNGTSWNLIFNGTSYAETTNQTYLLVKIGYTYSLDATSPNATYSGPKSVYVYSFNQQVPIEFGKNQSGNPLGSGLAFFGLTVANLADIIVVSISMAAAGLTFFFSKDILISIIPPNAIMWISYAMFLKNYGPTQMFYAILFVILGAAAFIISKNQGREQGGGM